ncbi:hypothetical protein [Streptomyces cyaneofuscatus]|uniref:hypothetical protein n=1 Tax=Streptomyces cyaneofuscatus TaxID=66883 RepID=UPI003439AA2D
MRRRILAVTPLAAILVIGGCTNSGDTGTSDEAGRKPSPTASMPAMSTAQASPSGGTSELELVIPGKAQVLVPETSGSGDKDLPAFTPSEEIYTVYAGCRGKGSVTLLDRDNPDGERHSIVCNDVQTVGVIHTEIEPQRLTVHVTGGSARWKVAVVSGDNRPA